MLQGIDVSRYQGLPNWAAVSASGVRFCMAKAAQGAGIGNSGRMFRDQSFAANLTGASAAGIACGAYHYFTAATETGALEEADYFCDALDEYRPLIQLWAAADIEEKTPLAPLTPQERIRLAAAFLRRVRERGYRPMLYANPDFIVNVFGLRILDTLRELGAELWLAAWGAKRETLARYGDVKIWQYSSTGRVSGIASDVDLNCGFFELPEKPLTAEAGLRRGDTVRVLEPIVYGTDRRFHVYYDAYTVLAASGDRVVIGVASGSRSVITAAVAAAHLEKIR